MLVVLISIKEKLFGLHKGKASYNENNNHFLFTFDLVEYNFKDVYKSFDISYFSKDDDLLSNNFVDERDLKEYESIEKIEKDMLLILIKKFKLKLTFKKSKYLSEYIVICDDSEFDVNNLNHADSLVKIAIVKDDYDNWLNSGNLNNYDYIFTFREYRDRLKEENYKVLPLKKETTYEMVKNILNTLYKRRADKFYLFIKNIEFRDIFPKWNNYFKVLNSEYFDDEWYKKTYNLKDNTDSATHYILIGFEKGNDPGPNFSTTEYYEVNPDVKNAGLNPLVHYEIRGRKENRSISSEKFYSLISNSPFFDKEWYEENYDISSEYDDPVTHYLKLGFKKGYNPGPDFNTIDYLDANPDVKKVGLNPLVHYEDCGREDGRSLSLDEYYSLISNSQYFDEKWYEENYDISSEYDDPVTHYLKLGSKKGYNPGPEFDTIGYLDANPDVKQKGLNPLVHYEMKGKKEGRLWSFEELISNSPYFDEEWYEKTYDLSEDSEEGAAHYLKIGYKKGYNPGPNFNTNEYYECNKDVKRVGTNPLLHYEMYGRNENRKLSLKSDDE